MIIFFILKLIGIILLTLILLLLFVPFRYFILARKHENAVIRAQGSWLFGLLMFTYTKEIGSKSKLFLNFSGLRFKIKPNKKKKEKINKKSGKSKYDDSNQRSKFRFFDKEFISPMLKALKELFNHIKPTKFRLEGRYGFEDPFYTGIALAAFNTINPLFKNYDVRTFAVFDDEIFEGSLSIKGRLILIVILTIALKTFLNKNVRRMIISKEEKAYVN